MTEKNIKQTYPTLPLRNLVIFSGNTSSLIVGREKSIFATQLAMDSERKLLLFAQKEVDIVDPKQEDIFDIGIIVEVLQLLKMPDDTYKVLVEGTKRVKLISFINKETHYESEYEEIESILPSENTKDFASLNELVSKNIQYFIEINKINHLVNDAFVESFAKKSLEDVIDTISHTLTFPFTTKHEIFIELDVLKRAQLLNYNLKSILDIATLDKNIHTEVQDRIDKIQRKFYLNEQLKVIQEELGEGIEDEIQNYKIKLDSFTLPEDIKKKAEQELGKLGKMPPISAEATVIRNYLDCIVDLPWNAESEEKVSLKYAKEVLDLGHYSLEKVKDRILEFVAVRHLTNSVKGSILCFVGYPGVGKTSLAKSFATCLNREFVRISLGGVRDEAEIRGHRRTYIGALPGRIIGAFKKAGVKNPVILLDEIDKISTDYRGNPAAALLEVLDHEQNSEFIDHYLEFPFDISKAVFIATANSLNTIPPALLDRLEIIEIPGYHENEKVNIAKNFLIPKHLKNSGLENLKIEYNDDLLIYLIRHYAKEAGVRQLDRELGKILRKIARKLLEAQEKKEILSFIKLTSEIINEYLGPEKYFYGKKDPIGTVGKANGMAWSQTGGDLLSIETALSFGKGNSIITGNLGDVMKESVNIAIAYLRTKISAMGIDSTFFEKTDVFVHFPEGATPKDGPSAGIAITLCLLSSLIQRSIPEDISFTGEITLHGTVLPIGGLREKILAAYRGGIRRIICPNKNKKDIIDIPDEILSDLTFHFVENFDEVIDIVFPNSKNLIFSNIEKSYSFWAPHLSKGSSSEISS